MGRPTDLSAHMMERTKNYAYVEGSIVAAPLDLGTKLDRADQALRDQGWLLIRHIVGTDFPSGDPRRQQLGYFMHRTDRPYAPEEAQAAFSAAIGQQGLSGSFAAWAGALASQFVRAVSEIDLQTGSDIATTAASGGQALLDAFGIGPRLPGQPRPLPWALYLGGGVVALMLLSYLSPFLPPRPRQ